VRRTLALVVLILLVAGLPLPALARQATPAASPAAGAPLPLDGERLATFEAFVAEMMAVLEVPGASIAVVQNGGVAYAQGFGVREIGRAKPVTADTLFMVGSVTKSFSSLLAATLVDAGELEWETPVADLLPGFAVADPALTTWLSVAEAFCACTGVPRRDLELVFGFDDLTPEEMIASIAGFPLVAPSARRSATATRSTPPAATRLPSPPAAPPGDLLAGYRHALRQRVLGPIGMGRSALTLDEVFAAGDYALPHGAGLDGVVRPLSPLRDQRFADTVAPAGSLWSSAREMAAYLQTQLAGGVAPDGSRVVSAENLGRTWSPRAVVDGTEGAPPVIATRPSTTRWAG
jgi:CubicO group peptidase (beta-lactamase class C family)